MKKYLYILIALSLFGTVAYTLNRVGEGEGYAPEQPIPFSHKLHAGVNNIPCMYCHANADKSKHATVPSANICMNCHSVVKTDSPWIKKVREHYEKGIPMHWVKVNDMPDFVNFSHKRHIAKGVTCETCHGEVKTMDRVRQDKPLTMGWCLECHKGVTTPDYLYDPKIHTGIPTPDGGLGHTRAAVLVTAEGDETKVPATPHTPGSPVAPANCYTCHH